MSWSILFFEPIKMLEFAIGNVVVVAVAMLLKGLAELVVSAVERQL